jgi:gliding motility-associated-like protein
MGEELYPGTTMDFPMLTFQGCDSIVTVAVLENPTYDEMVELSACEGETVLYEGVAYPPGTQEVFNFTTAAGCDSTITLTVVSNPVFAEAVALETCVGSSIEFAGVMLAGGTDTLFLLLNQNGCDSLIQVTVTEVDAYQTAVALSACEGEMALYEGLAYPTGTDETFTYSSVQGCDSIVHLTVASMPVYEMAETYSACSGTEFMYAGAALLPGSVTEFTFTTFGNCDSIVTATVLENTAYAETVELSACEGETVLYEGIAYPAGTTEIFNFTTAAGCDSVITLHVAELLLSENTVNVFTCAGTTTEYNGDDLAPGTYEYIFENQLGCDSVVEVVVGELLSTYETLTLTGCEGSTISYGGQDYAVGTQVDLTYQTYQGCDSVVSLTISALEVPVSTLELTICADDSLAYGTTFLYPGTTTEFVFESVDGCDSIVIISLEAYPEFDFTLSAPDILCWNDASGEILIEAVTGGTAPFSYAYDQGSFQSDTILTGIGSGQHVIYVQDAHGCVEEQALAISEIPPLEVFLEAPVLPCQADSIMVEAQLLRGATDSMLYHWLHGVQGNQIAIYNPGTYTLEVTNLCETRRFDLEVTLGHQIGEGYFYIPNSFSPNGDGANDVFTAYAANDVEVLSYELHLYDRWGNALYNTNDLAKGWDGKMKEENLNVGVYVWWLRAEVLVCGREQVSVFEKGDVTIFR